MTTKGATSVWRGSVGLGVLLAGVCLWVVTTQSDHHIFLYSRVCLAGIAAIGLNLLMGTAGQVSVGTAGFLAIGGFGTVAASRAGIPFPLDMATAVVVAGVIGGLVGIPALRLRGLYLLLTTLAAHFLVVYVVEKYQREAVGAGGFSLRTVFTDVGFAEAGKRWAWLATAGLAFAAAVVRVLSSGGYGNSLRFLRDHEAAAPVLGIAVTRYKVAIFVASSVVIAFAGALQAHVVGSVAVDQYTLFIAIAFIAMIVIGGLDSVAGAIVGAAVVTLLPELTSNVVDRLASGDPETLVHVPRITTLIYGVLLIVFIAFWPNGLVGIGSQVKRVMRRIVRFRSSPPGAQPPARPEAPAEARDIDARVPVPDIGGNPDHG